ncbi:hypothetical protein J7T55_005887 [Diaporthe amygdali]|uniref:uncharacterized protein n=1 Tax=Phomopsis amygdali TaxID=1214568 RepID=UPI0022FDF98F|nr:uncharacterized protein J7T55_005887 [Diaporthe amygdali]KAJ0124549.1 hypothetical protein J7T55_005887 [Diaporthe amygdali]
MPVSGLTAACADIVSFRPQPGVVEDIKMPPEPIALVGSSCRFSGNATSPSKLWTLLADPTDLSRPIPNDRFSAMGFFHEDAEHHGTTDSPYGYWLDQKLDQFDAAFFNITRKEAEAMDPQQRLLLEVVYEALESAGYSLKQFAGRNVGVYTGVMTTDYRSLSERDELNSSQYAATGNASSIIANRISYFYDFHGPSMTIDTACSASLVALHQAVLGLRSGETEMACVAGVNLMLTPEQFISESNLHMLSPTGHCRMWDIDADGYARGEGIVAIFIKTLTRALAEGDNIQAIIRHTGANSDGKTQGITMPNPTAQATLIRTTYEKSDLDPREPDHQPQYFEAHGTGTPAGDPREARAIANAFFGDNEGATANSNEKSPRKILVGSIKTIIGHTEGAAGLAGILKVVVAMQNSCVPGNLHHDSLNPSVRPFYENLQIPTQALDWPSPPTGHPMRASVNSFGFGGTNAHAIVERYQPEIHGPGTRLSVPLTNTRLCSQVTAKYLTLGSPHQASISLPVVISAASEPSFIAVLKDLLSYIDHNPHITTQELAWHLYSRRTAHSLKAFLVPGPGKASSIMSSLQSLIEQASRTSLTQSGDVVRSKKTSHGPRILGIFTGQGAQYAAMSKGLLRTSTVYCATIKKLDQILQKDCPDPPEWSLEEKIMDEGEDSDVGVAAIAQPLCTALQVALVELLSSLRVSFHCVIGHSSGEIAAAFAAKRLSMRDAILIAYYRASNSPSLVTLSGDAGIIAAASDELKSEGKLSKILKVDTAYHSFHMVQPVKEYSHALASCAIQAQPPVNGGTPIWVSSVHGRQDAASSEELETRYWMDNMLHPVLFYEAVKMAMEELGPFECAIEVGPHPQLQTPAMETFVRNTGKELLYHGLLQRGRDAENAFADFLGFMCVNFGTSAVDIRRFVQDSLQPELILSRLIDAPIYAWDHNQVHWRESRLSAQYHFREHPPHELLGVRTRDDNQFQMRWRNILKVEKIPWVNDHRFQGQALLPASAYCIMALDAAKVVVAGRNASIVELQDLKFLSSIIMEPDSLGVETLFTFQIVHSPQSQSDQTNIIEADFTLTSGSVVSSKPGPMKKNFEGRALIVLGDASPDALPSRSVASLAETLPVDVATFYQMMDSIGLSYTGPFHALRSIDRRVDYATATLIKANPADTTNIDLSPAFLDSCFHATFATFSSPGDKALWTSFLPTKIGRIRFNLALCDKQSTSATMTVESHLTKFDAFSFGSPAALTADLSISNEIGQTEVQLEDLIVSSFSPARPEDDYELYLHTVMDVDPELEIVTMAQQPMGVREHIIESCERVAQIYLKWPTDVSPTDTPPNSPLMPEHPVQCSGDATTLEEVPAEVENFVTNSLYSWALNVIRSPQVVEMSHTHSLDFPRMYQSIVDDAQLIQRFRRHLGRIVQQISHRFPRMDVLDLTLAEWNLTENILDGLNNEFSSFTLMASTKSKTLLNRCPTLVRNKKVSFEDLDLDTTTETIGAPSGAYDLVIVSTAIFSRFASDKDEIIRKVRYLIRKRGFLIIVHMPTLSILENKLSAIDEDIIQNNSGAVMPPDLDGPLLKSMFLPAAQNSTQIYASGLSMTIRQAEDELLISKNGKFQESVIVVGKAAARFGLERHSASHDICGNKEFKIFDHIEDVTSEAASAATVVVLLMDLTDPVCSNMTREILSTLKAIMQPGKIILWVTSATQRDPETAASLGLTRTLKAENPNLILQVLDFCNASSQSTDLIMDRLMILLLYRDSLQKMDNARENMLFTFESEIHVSGKRQIVPRVLPYKPAIERLNANRREVSRTCNSLEACLLISSVQGTDGLNRFEVSRIEDCGTPLVGHRTGRFVNVEYSSLHPLSTDMHDLYLCIGLAADNAQPVVGVSSYLASRAPAFQTIDLPQNLADRRAFASWVPPMVSAADLAASARPGDVVLIDPGLTFLQCARAVLPPRVGSSGYAIHVLMTNPDLARGHADIKYIHPLSSGRDLKRLIPCTNPTVVNFLRDGHDLSKVLRSLAGDFEYIQWSTPLRPRRDKRPLINGSAWIELLTGCIDMACRKPSQNESPIFVTPQVLHGASGPNSPFAIVDWKSDRYVTIPVKPLVEPRLLKSNRTYLLVGLTRDLGQSLCRLFIRHGARNIVVASRSPNKAAIWISELNSEGANIRAQQLDVTDLESVKYLSTTLSNVGGIVNGAMVLEDKVFAQMDIDTWTRVMRPKTVGSSNLDKVFNSRKLDFFIMTSSFAAIGGHAGQSNYAAANMFMNGLAANRRQRGLVGSVLNIGVIYGLGLLARERQEIYHNLEMEGYPPISERDIHHMFLEAIVAGRPTARQIMDLTTGLSRYRVNDPKPLHWHRDSRFCHFTVNVDDDTAGPHREGPEEKNIKELIDAEISAEAISNLLSYHFCRHIETILQLSVHSVTPESHIFELGVDSLVAVEIRNWFYKRVGSDVPVMKILQPLSISELCLDIANKIVGERK